MSEPKCPKCNKGALQSGYGLAGGSIGPYTYCDNEHCDFFDKVQDLEIGDPPQEAHP